MYSFTSVIALGVDSFLACTVIGMLSLSTRERLRLAVAFGVADAIATPLGPVIAHQWLLHSLSFGSPDLNASAFAAIAICSVAPSALGAFLLRTPHRRRSLLYLAPILCSLDNLFAGNPPAGAPLAGLSSACLAFAGLTVGLACRNLFARIAAEA